MFPKKQLSSYLGNKTQLHLKIYKRIVPYLTIFFWAISRANLASKPEKYVSKASMGHTSPWFQKKIVQYVLGISG